MSAATSASCALDDDAARRPPVRAVDVVVPARDEERLLPGALAALRVAVDELARARPDVDVVVTVVLDACTDGTADVVAAAPWVRALPVAAGTVGAARTAGVEAALSRLERVRGTSADRPAAQRWIANTDADSQVPADWLTTQLDLADAGTDLVLGTVEPDPADTAAADLAAWHTRHVLAEDHPHVYGANLGIRLSTWVEAGGFGAGAAHEDVRLVRAAVAAGACVVATDRIRVLTSGRTTGRAPAGFADYLRTLRRRTG